MSKPSHCLPAQLPAGERLLSLPQVLARVPKSYRTIYRWMEQELFPRAYKIGPNSVAWRESEIDQWIAEQTATAA